MNTIPTTISENLPPYTAVGGASPRGDSGLSLVLLDRGTPYSRHALFQELEKEEFDHVIAIEGPQKHYDLEELAGKFPFVRFILLNEGISPGEAINLAASEIASPLFFVLWSDFRLVRSGGAERMAGRLLLGLGKNEERREYKRICTVPVIQNSRVETLATLSAPALDKRIIRTVPFTPDAEGLPTLYPYGGIGVYDRERFLRSGGFDGGIKNFHWQLLDFGFRAWLWGEEIASTRAVRLSCEGLNPIEDGTLDSGYRRFYLKNLAPVFRGDHAHIPLKTFPGYCWRMRGDVVTAWEEFSAARRWVRTNRYRFKNGIPRLTALWRDLPEGCAEAPPL